MIILQSVTKKVLAIILISGLLAVAVVSELLHKSVDAQEITSENLTSYFQALSEASNSFYIGFIASVGDESGWEVPSRLGNEDEVIGIREIAEIGEDFVCIVETYNVRKEHLCVPFSNIAYIIHDPILNEN